MKMRAFQYHRPDTLVEALAVLAEFGGDAKVIAGGQSLVPMMAMRLSTPDHIVDISKVPGLDEIKVAEGFLTIEAMVRHAVAETNPLVATAAPLVFAAMPHIGHRAIRNRGTVCGSLAHADPAAELPAVARALDAEFVVASSTGVRLVPAAEFFVGYLTSALADSEMVTAVRFPVADPNTVVSVTEVSRRHGDFALAGCAAQLSIAANGTIDTAAMALFGVDSVPYRSAVAEAMLVGNMSTSDVFAAASAAMIADLHPPADNHGSTAYRRHLAGVLVRRALADAASKISHNVGALA